jgi:DNA-binding winged helix-turn-helix (wHTH) protein
MDTRGTPRYEFGPFHLDPDNRQLLREGEPVALTPKVFDALIFFVQNSGRVILKDDLLKALWPDTFVAEVNLPVLIHRLREALGDDPRDPRFVRTVTRFGYAFCGPAWIEGEGASSPVEYEYRVVVGAKEVVLRPGDNLLGRAHDAAVRVDQTSVSRLHDTTAATENGATIADCGSKNGTFVGSQRVSSPTALQDGDRILLGAALLVFRCYRRDTAGGDADPASRPTTPLAVPPGEGQHSHV